jgi:ABC-type polysaccharide/polyol phosphate export permease
VETQATELHAPGKRSLVGAPDVLRALIRKELKVKYKRSLLGFLWSLITPVAMTGIYLFVFVYVYRVPQEDFIFFLLTGLLPWHFFNLSLLAGTTSLVDNSPIIRKVLFPRHLVPISAVGANLINFLVALGFLIVVLMLSGRPVLTQFHWILVALVLETALCIAAVLTLSIANVYFRDIRQLISLMLIGLFFATPIVYDISLVPESFRVLIYINPLAAVIEAYHGALFRVATPDLTVIAIGFGEILLLLAIGIWTFRKFGPQLPKEL